VGCVAGIAHEAVFLPTLSSIEGSGSADSSCPRDHRRLTSPARRWTFLPGSMRKYKWLQEETSFHPQLAGLCLRRHQRKIINRRCAGGRTVRATQKFRGTEFVYRPAQRHEKRHSASQTNWNECVEILGRRANLSGQVKGALLGTL